MPTRLRIGFVAFHHATNSFSPTPTDLDDFLRQGILRGPELLEPRGAWSLIGDAIDAADVDGGIDVVPLLAASALSSGRVTTPAFETIAGEIETSLARMAPDAVVLDLHGAMMTDAVDDGDAATLRRVREIVGRETPIVVALSARANVTHEMTELADAILVHEPLLGGDGVGRDALRLAAAAARGEVRPTCAFVRAPMLCLPPTRDESVEAVRSVSVFARELERRPGVLSAGFTLGFLFTDSAAAGAGAIVTTDGDPLLASQCSGEMAALLLTCRGQLRQSAVPVEAAVHTAMETEGDGVIMLADLGDDPGSGGAGDGTALLWALLDLGADNSALGVIVDPEVVALAFSVGLGSRIDCELGGKRDDLHGFPIPINGIVRSLTDGAFTYEGPRDRGRPGSLGRTAMLACDGRYGHVVEVIVSEQRLEASDPAIFRSQEIEPTAKRILAVKSAVQFRQAFAPLARSIVGVDTPGLTNGDVARLGHTKLARPIWPLDPL